MNKEFIPYDQIRNNILKLAHSIEKEWGVPDVIYVSLRGGAYMGNVLSEYFKLVNRNKRPVFYAAVAARSYTDVRKQEQMRIDGWTYNPEHLRSGDKVLLVDDIFDSGKTINYLANVIVDKGIPREDLKIAVHDYKIFPYLEDQLPIHPDYFCRKHIIESPEKDLWIHYMSHELVGLSAEELEEHYYSKDPELREIFKGLL